MVFITLTDPERQALKRLSRRAVGRVALRAQRVLLSDRGYAVAQIAHLHDCGGEGVRTWLHRYQSKGLAGLEDEPRSGRPRKEPLAAQIVLTEALPVAALFGTGLCWLDGRVAARLLGAALLGGVVGKQHPPVSKSRGLPLAATPPGAGLRTGGPGRPGGGR